MGLRDAIFGRRDAAPAPVRMIGFTSDGGLLPGGVTAATALGLSSVWRSLDVLSNGTSQLPWREVLGNLELPPSRLVIRPLGFGTRREWVSYVTSVLALYDIAYLLKVGGYDREGVPMGLLPLDPGQVMPVLATQTISPFLPAASYWVGTTEVPEDRLVILHRSPLPGVTESTMGVIRLARITFAAAIAAENYASRYWQAGGSPTTVLETDATVPDPIAQQLSDRWAERRRRGPDYAPVMDRGLKARDMGVDPMTTAAVEARREQVADIGRYFGLPTRLLNAPTGDSETYTSTPAANQDLVRFTLQNFIGAIEDAISDQLPGGRRMEMPPERLTRGTQYEQAQALNLATGNRPWMTPDEARDYVGLPPIESPDSLNPPAPVPVIASGGIQHG
jgi:HK97 family phage portal protein